MEDDLGTSLKKGLIVCLNYFIAVVMMLVILVDEHFLPWFMRIWKEARIRAEGVLRQLRRR